MGLPLRSVKAEHIDLGAVRAEHMQIAAPSGLAIAQASTTNTSDYFTVQAYAFHMPTPKVLFLAPYHIHVKHSVANGRFELFIGIYTPPGAGSPAQTAMWAGSPNSGGDPVTLHATAGEWQCFNGVAACLPELVFSTPGTKNLYMFIKNRTAGTLTWGHPSGVDFLSHLMVGR